MTGSWLTQEAFDRLTIELVDLQGPRRAEIVKKIADAREEGDLKENGGYHAAREEQGKLEERIATIEHILKFAEVVDHAHDGTINIGSTVVIQKEGETNTRTFLIVGSEETDMLSGKISYKSPLGQSLQGKKQGDMITVTTPKSEVHYTIISVQ